MNLADTYYLENLRNIMLNGSWDYNPRPKYADGTPAKSKYITQVCETYYEKDSVIPTLRNTAIKTGVKEIFWIYQWQSNKLEDAHKLEIDWWNSWDVGDGTIGNRYGYTVAEHNLMNNLLRGLEKDPTSRRHIMNLYQEDDLKSSGGLFPCAYETIWSVRDGFLDTTLIQRSSDYLVANHINKVQYKALQMMVAGHLTHTTGQPHLPGRFVHFVQNLHIYDRHFDAVEEIQQRKSKDTQPMLLLKENKNFYEYTIGDFVIIDNVGEKIKSPLELAI